MHHSWQNAELQNWYCIWKMQWTICLDMFKHIPITQLKNIFKFVSFLKKKSEGRNEENKQDWKWKKKKQFWLLSNKLTIARMGISNITELLQAVKNYQRCRKTGTFWWPHNDRPWRPGRWRRPCWRLSSRLSSAHWCKWRSDRQRC